MFFSVVSLTILYLKGSGAYENEDQKERTKEKTYQGSDRQGQLWYLQLTQIKGENILFSPFLQ
jgi:hypothetical protein